MQKEHNMNAPKIAPTQTNIALQIVVPDDKLNQPFSTYLKISKDSDLQPSKS